jgi:methionyl-tRNA formyltransferase
VTDATAASSPSRERARVLFYGTPAIAVPTLRALAAAYDVVAVVCQPDAAAGRSHELNAPATKVAALELGIPVHQPAKVRTPEFVQWVRDQRADVAVVIAYGRILIQEVLDAPVHGCVNLHASILPKLRGAAPITWAIARGDAETGVSVMKMDAGVDTGPVYSIHRVAITPDETTATLSEKLALLAAHAILEDLPKILAGELSVIAQDHASSTLAPILKKEDGLVDWSRSAREVSAHVRAMDPWPGAYSLVRGKLFKVLKVRVDPILAGLHPGTGTEPGTVISASKRGIVVKVGDGVIVIDRGQLEGRKALDAAELAGGRALVEGDVLRG